MTKKLYYAVAVGRATGIFHSWPEAEASVKGYPGAKHKGFQSKTDAQSYLDGFMLMTKHNCQMEAAKKEEQQYNSSPNPNPFRNSTAQTINVPQSSSGRMASIDVDQEYDDGAPKFYIDESPSWSSGTSSKSNPYKRSHHNSISESNKKPRLPPNLEIIDLTEDEPSSTFRNDKKQLADFGFESYSRKREIPDNFSLDDCSPEQRRVLESVSQGKNVFYTGSAGVGKSFVLHKMCQMLERQKLKKFEDFFVTASTGISAVQIGGMTIHSFAGTGKAEDGIRTLREKCARTKNIRKHWELCKVLIIDEVSMISDELFDKLNAIGQHIRKNTRPFGGIQLVLCGDFYQLPPVPDNTRRCPECGDFNSRPLSSDPKKLFCLGKLNPNKPDSEPCTHIYNRESGYIFQSEAWKQARFNIIELTRIFRQSDSVFVTALNKTRIGMPDREVIDLFSGCTRPLPNDDSIVPTRMYPIRKIVDEENTKQFNALSMPIYDYTAVDTQTQTDGYTPNLKWVLKDLQAQSLVRMRVGAQVMLLANLDVKEGLVNGSRGVVTAFVSTEEAKQQATAQFWSRTGQGDDSIAHAEIDQFSGGDDSLEYPKVLFETNNGKKEIIITPHKWTLQLGWNLFVSRVQIPLMAAWALTIHKCQGMTLDKCVLDLTRCFGPGMAYVALSRCRSLEGLQIVGWQSGSEIKADPVVTQFYESLKGSN